MSQLSDGEERVLMSGIIEMDETFVGPDAFNGVGMNVSPDKFILRMVDGLMSGVMVSHASVGRPLVGKDGYRFWSDVLQGDFMESLTGAVRRNLKDYFTVPLYHTYHQGLVAFVASPLPSVLPPTKVSSISMMPESNTLSSPSLSWLIAVLILWHKYQAVL
jgi:hypothetical protein